MTSLMQQIECVKKQLHDLLEQYVELSKNCDLDIYATFLEHANEYIIFLEEQLLETEHDALDQK